jgi:hypothetical protein
LAGERALLLAHSSALERFADVLDRVSPGDKGSQSASVGVMPMRSAIRATSSSSDVIEAEFA